MSGKHVILTTMRQGRTYSSRELAAMCQMDTSNMRRTLQALERAGLVESTGERRARVFKSRQLELEL